jgi:hypothetical protein
MSVKSIRRFDKYIPLFGKDNDDRVTLLLGELEDVAVENKNIATRKNFIDSDIGLNKVTPGLQNQYFITKDPDPTANDTTVHPEWKNFMLQLAIRLGGKELLAKHLPVVQGLSKAVVGSPEEFMLHVFNKIATFTDGATTPVPNRDFIAHKSLLDKATKVTFKDALVIIKALSNSHVMETISEDYMLISGLSLDNFNNLTPADENVISLQNTYDYFKSSRLSNDFANYLKVADTSKFFKLPLTNANLKKGFIDTLKDFIKSLDTKVSFGYNFDKYLKNKLFDAQQGVLSVPTASSFFDDAIVDQGKYWRKADGSLWTMDANGKEEQVDINSQKFKDLKASDKCLGTNVNEFTGSKSCADYLRDCLSGNDVKKCVAFLKEDKYWNVVEKEVDEMLPAIALKTLESFEFKTVDTYDETNKMNIRKVISVTEWLANLLKMVKASTELDDAAYKAIAGNEKLKGYLALLVKKVNFNPAILNRGITKSDEQKRYNPNAFTGSKLATMGLKPRLAVSPFAPSSIDRLASTVRSDQDAIRIRLMGPSIFSGILTGGSAAIDDLENKLKDETKQTWGIFQNHYLALVNQLKGMGKDIAEEDKNKIKDLFEQLKKSELKLMQVILMTEKYKDLISIHGEKDNSNTLKIDHLKQFVDQRNKYFTRVAKKQNDLISIIKSISEAVQKEAPTKTEPLAEPKQEKLALAGLLG